ncbi:TetR/AcrR family transcriptional regulator [Marinactinospora endophytica]
MEDATHTDAQRPRPRTGRPPLSEQSKAATRLRIAREAVRLFTAQGVAKTSSAEIARAADISPRTLWRYFSAKEECVSPLLSAGVEALVTALRDRTPGQVFSEALRSLSVERSGNSWAIVQLVRLTRTEPGVRSVWVRTHLDAEPLIAEVIALRIGASPEDLRPRVQAAVLNVALRAAVEDFAWHPRDDGRSLDDTVREALAIAAEGLSD